MSRRSAETDNIVCLVAGALIASVAWLALLQAAQ